VTGDEQEKQGTQHGAASRSSSSRKDESADPLSRHPSLVTRHQLPTRHHLPIGVFDSGVGGLTVLRALRQQLPHEHFVYLGDTARLPYGTKSAQSVTRYSLQAADFLVRRGIKYLVVACNTASSVALDALRERFSPLPVVGVIGPGTEAACAATRTNHIAVIATEGTIGGGAYQREIAGQIPGAVVISQACSLFVALAEEGWTRGEIVESVARRYLGEMLEQDRAIDTLLLGCTHFPVLMEALRAAIGPKIAIVDSAQTTAAFLLKDLQRRDLMRETTEAGAVQLLATDSAERFARVGTVFLAETFSPTQVEVVDLGPSAT
jgi:glutamate racemase